MQKLKNETVNKTKKTGGKHSISPAPYDAMRIWKIALVVPQTSIERQGTPKKSSSVKELLGKKNISGTNPVSTYERKHFLS